MNKIEIDICRYGCDNSIGAGPTDDATCDPLDAWTVRKVPSPEKKIVF